jgi:hypothetical protein
MLDVNSRLIPYRVAMRRLYGPQQLAGDLLTNAGHSSSSTQTPLENMTGTND